MLHLERTVSQMVYCDLIKCTGDSAIYAFGVNIANVTGEVEFFSQLRAPRIIRQPKGENVSVERVARVAHKYKAKFAAGEYPGRVAYER